MTTSKYSGWAGPYGKISQTQAIVDLPVSSGTAAKITITGDLTAQVLIYCSAAFWWTLADTDANAATRIASDATRMYLPAGLYAFPVAGIDNMNLYIISASSAVTDGLSYALINAD